MSISSISLSSSARSNLLSLQQTAKLLGTTENNLSTGKKVNSALDNATEYFASKGFLNRANDLSNLKDSLAVSLQTVATATAAIDSITSLVGQMQATALSALQTNDATSRTNYATQFKSIMAQLDGLVSDSTFNGTNLLDKSSNLLVYFNENNTTALTISGVNITSSGLAIADPTVANFATIDDIKATQSQLQTALNTLRSDSALFGNSTTVVTTRQDFTNNLINTLQTASDDLILADTNEESANLQALQTRNQLSVISLGISNTAQQAILRLF